MWHRLTGVDYSVAVGLSRELKSLRNDAIWTFGQDCYLVPTPGTFGYLETEAVTLRYSQGQEFPLVTCLPSPPLTINQFQIFKTL